MPRWRRCARDLISLRIMGWGDGATAVDYTVNAAAGIPMMTGPQALGAEPVNSVLPAWDLLAGAYGAFSLLAAERSRRDGGPGGEIRLPLGDLAAATLGHLGQLAEVLVSGTDRGRNGNDLFGAFGRDFATADGKRLMIVAITGRQWSDLVASLAVGVRHRGTSKPSSASRSSATKAFAICTANGCGRSSNGPSRRGLRTSLHALFDATGVCWAPYRTVLEAAEAKDRFGIVTPGMSEVAHPSGTYPTPGAAAGLTWATRRPAQPAPRLGQHTEEVLAGVLALPGHEIARLHDAGLVAS